MSIGEKPTIAILNAGASMRMALAEALTNMAGVAIKGLNYVQVSANWMAASGDNQEDLNLRNGVEALSKLSSKLKISIPVGKDSLSMKTKWNESDAEFEVKSPLSGIITAMAPVDDIALCVTPEIDTKAETKLVLVKLNQKTRLGGSIFSEVIQETFNETPDIDDADKFKDMFYLIQDLVKNKNIIALHDISDGGLVTSIAEMCFTKKIGATIDISDFENINQTLFNEEIGFVIQIENSQLEKVLKLFEEKNLFAKEIADLNNNNFVIKKNKKIIF